MINRSVTIPNIFPPYDILRLSSNNNIDPLLPPGIQLLVNWPLLNPQYWHVSVSIIACKLTSAESSILTCSSIHCPKAVTCPIFPVEFVHICKPHWLYFILMGHIRPILSILTCNIHPCSIISSPLGMLVSLALKCQSQGWIINIGLERGQRELPPWI